MVIIETISPQQYAKLGPGFTIFYDFQDTIFGNCLVGTVDNSNSSICHLAFVGEDREKGLKLFRERWKLSNLVQNSHVTKRIANQIFRQESSDNITVLLKGTDFQIGVWKALTQIPAGTCVTYEKVAQMVANPKGARAVAAALAANQVGYLIPCHRVVCKSGCNKFSWGTKVKEKMQNFEKGAVYIQFWNGLE